MIFNSIISKNNPTFYDIIDNPACKSHEKRTFHAYHKILSNGGKSTYLFIINKK